MGGIGGIFFRDGQPVQPGDAQALIDALAHRGPDGCRSWSDGECGLIHCALRTTPESLYEELPLVQEGAGRFVVTADARLDNRADLLASLELGKPSRTVTDADLLLAAYLKWSDACVEHLLGDFSFSIWDRSERRLFCARDHLGARSFYYFASDELFIFGSEIKAVLTRGEVPRRLNEERVADYLSERFTSKDDTFYRDVRRLPAGCSLYVDRERLQLRRYWDYDPEREIRMPSERAYAVAFHDLLKESVRARLRTIDRPGAHLSGGLDSSSVAVLSREILAEENREPLHTFTARFPDIPSCDETVYASSVLEQGGFEPHFVDPGKGNLLEDLDEMLWHQDQPIYWPSWVLERDLLGAARDIGIHTVLTGVSGDLTLSHGAGYFSELFQRGRWMRLVREVRAFSELRGLDPRRMLWKEAVRPALSGSVPTSVRRRMWRRKFDGVPFEPLIHPDLDRRIGFTERARAQALEKIAGRRTQRGHHYWMLEDDALTRSLETGDIFSVAFGIRLAHPFYDKRLMEFGLALPSDQKLHQGLSRVVLRRGMEGKLPDRILNRWTKIGLVALVGRSFLDQNRLVLEKFDESGLDELDGLVNVPHVRQILRRQLANDSRSDDRFVLDAWPDLWSILGCVILHRWVARLGNAPT